MSKDDIDTQAGWDEAKGGYGNSGFEYIKLKRRRIESKVTHLTIVLIHFIAFCYFLNHPIEMAYPSTFSPNPQVLSIHLLVLLVFIIFILIPRYWVNLIGLAYPIVIGMTMARAHWNNDVYDVMFWENLSEYFIRFFDYTEMHFSYILTRIVWLSSIFLVLWKFTRIRKADKTELDAIFYWWQKSEKR